MGHFLGSGWFILLITAVRIGAQKTPSINVSSKCLGNVLRLNTSALGGNILEAAVGINATVIPLTSSLASQCGFSMRMDPLGGAMIFASLQNCFAKNMEDKTFTTVVHLRLHGNDMTEDELYRVVETCSYTPWASREILCDPNYMEVSVRRTIPEDFVLREQPIPGTKTKSGDRRRAAKQQKQTGTSGFRITSIVFLTPEERVMRVDEAQRRGYGVANTPTRLVVRTPQNAPETYTLDVGGVLMRVLKTSTIFEKKWLATKIDAAAACPTPTGGVSFTPNMITWYFPWHIDPLITSDHFRLLEVHMGINGQRLETAEMDARQYVMTVNESHIIIDIPVGAVDGYFKSHVEDDHYLITYNIEPMLELLWIEDDQEDTRYKVLFPITTPPVSRPPQVIDNTVPEEKVFKVLLGPLGSDVVLVNITFSTEVLSVAECNARRFNIQEHKSENGSKAFTLEVPFTDPVVLHTKEMGITVFHLNMIFGLLVLPELSPFAHPAALEVALVDIVPPSVSGGCDHEKFYINVKYGNRGFQTVVGKQKLTPALAQQYSFMENGTHFSFAVPFLAPDAVFEAVQSSSIRSRLDVALTDPETNTNIQDLSVACNFPSSLTECFSNGTMTALAVKLESVPSLNPSQLTLRDPACGPSFSDSRFAYFLFTGSTCGTTRKFLSSVMVYENEISLPDDAELKTDSKPDEPEYELKVSCYYDVNTTHSVAFLIRPRNNEPYADPATGQLQIAMRLFLDDSYSLFHENEEYPIPKYLRQPLYFEVGLMKSANPEVALELENCWATLHDDSTSQPRWNLIINGCANPVDPHQVVFHPVWADARVQYPSHFKRFEVQMFAFATDQDDLSDQVFVHCDVIICDANSPTGGPCSGQCSNQDNRKHQKREVLDVPSFKRVSSGPIALT